MYKDFEFKDLLGFEVMIFPKIATIFYLLLMGLSMFAGFVMVVRGIGAEWGGGAIVGGGLALMTIVPVTIRMWFEILLVLFMINDKLGVIKGALTKSSDVSISETKPVKKTAEGPLCPACGKENKAGAAFCSFCGAKLS